MQGVVTEMVEGVEDLEGKLQLQNNLHFLQAWEIKFRLFNWLFPSYKTPKTKESYLFTNSSNIFYLFICLLIFYLFIYSLFWIDKFADNKAVWN